MVIARDWWDSGWDRFLPPQAMYLHMLVATATVADRDGSLEDLASTLGKGWFELRVGTWDAPLNWDPDGDADAEQQALDAERKRVFEAALIASGRHVPTTVAELAALLADVGVFIVQRSGTERWRSTEVLPLVAERLAVDVTWADAEDAHRWRIQSEEAAQRIIVWVEGLGRPHRLAVTLLEVAEGAGLALEEARFGLTSLLDDGDFVLLGEEGSLDPERIEAARPLTLGVDWDRFAENRITIRRVRREVD